MLPVAGATCLVQALFCVRVSRGACGCVGVDACGVMVACVPALVFYVARVDA